MEDYHSLDTLPDELILRICHYIERLEHLNKRSLRALALTNKRLSKVAIEAFYLHALVCLQSKYELQSMVDRLSRTARHIRSLTLTGLGLYINFPPEERPVFNLHVPKPTLGWAFGHTDDKVDGDVYAPFASLIPTISKLADLNYDVVSPIPLSILDSLHKYHPKCRLRINNFRLQSLVNDGQVLESDWKLVTSPCLHRVVVGIVLEDMWIDHNLEAVKEMVGGLAPNLKEVYIRQGHHFREDLRSTYMGMPPWKGLRNLRLSEHEGSSAQLPEPLSNADAPIQRGALEYLSIKYERDDLTTWFNITDSSKLRVLDVAKISHTTLARLSTLSFASLESLAITLFNDPFTSVPWQQYDAAAATFFASLAHSRLNSLKIRTSINKEVWDAVLANLGSKLRKIHLKQECAVQDLEHAVKLDLEESQRIKDCCPNLEELSIKSEYWLEPYFFQSQEI